MTDGPEHIPEVTETTIPESTEGVSISFQEFLEKAFADLDGNPDLSPKEKRTLKKVLEKVAAEYQTEKSVIRRTTAEEIQSLQSKVTSRVAMRTLDKGPDRLSAMDLEDIAQFLRDLLNPAPLHQPGARTDNVHSFEQSRANTDRRIAAKATIDAIAREKRIEDVETVGDLRELSVDVLIRLEDAHEGILLYAFTDFVDDSTHIDLDHFEEFYKNPSPGIRLRFDFRGNIEAEAKVGAADVLPPSVRRITIYEGGDPQLVRTSTRRIGLKGQNKQGHGFFDHQGYIPVYTGDVAIVGGDQRTADDSGIDRDFEAKYRNLDGTLNYNLYAKDFAADEKQYLDRLGTQGIRRGKVHTTEELNAVERSIEASGIRKAIVSAAMELVKDRTPGAHCWDWIEKVYRAAGAKRGAVVYQHPKYRKRGFDRNHPSKHENPRNVRSLQPGDWLFIYNKNGIDTYDDHSVLFLGWENEAELIAKVANCRGAGRVGDLRIVNFKQTPVTMWIKPKR